MYVRGLTFDDVILVPGYNGIKSRQNVTTHVTCMGRTFGIPVITNPEGGMGNIKIKNYQEGIVCPKDEILKNVYDLLDHPNRRHQIGQAARKLIKSEYSFDKSVEKLNKIYEDITQK